MKYNLGETLWIMRSNLPRNGIVIGRQYTQLQSSEDENYLIRYDDDGDVHWHHGDLLFASRDALMASLG
jgi:hypothetical protein